MANYHLTYTQAPLPFQGQKRFFIQQFAGQIAQYPSDSTFIDLFGGSGLLSRVCKDIHPSARVLYNDHDHYSDRLALIPQTETIRQRLLPPSGSRTSLQAHRSSHRTPHLQRTTRLPAGRSTHRLHHHIHLAPIHDALLRLHRCALWQVAIQ